MIRLARMLSSWLTCGWWQGYCFDDWKYERFGRSSAKREH